MLNIVKLCNICAYMLLGIYLYDYTFTFMTNQAHGFKTLCSNNVPTCYELSPAAPGSSVYTKFTSQEPTVSRGSNHAIYE